MVNALNPRRIYQEYTVQLALCTGLLTLSSANFGFDQTGYSTIQAMNPFAKQFGGKCNAKGVCTLDSTHLSFLNGFPFLTFSVGSLIGSMISERYGRKPTTLVMSFWALVCAGITISSKTYSQILAARCLNYVYAGMELALIPVYQSELAPSNIRGFIVGSYQMSISCGVILVSIVAKFTATIPNNNAWRIPVALYFFVPFIVCCLGWFLPESPRWLIAHGRADEARKVLQRIRVNRDPEAIEAEISLIEIGLVAHESKEKSTYAQLFRGITRRRTLIAMGCCFFLQASGQSMYSQYGTVFVKSLNSFDPFSFKLIASCLQLVGCLSAMYLMDALGRRPIMITGITVQMVALYTLAGLGTISSPASKVQEANKGIVAMMTIIPVSYSAGWGALNWVVVAELADQTMRDKAQRVATWVNFATNCTITFVVPYLWGEPANLSAKVGFIFGSLALLGSLFGYFFIPELKNRTQEEINLLFDSHISARQSVKWRPTDLRAELELQAAKGHKSDIEEEEKDQNVKQVDARLETV